MDAQKYLEQMQEIQNSVLQFIENVEKVEENFQNLIQLLDDHKIRDDKHFLKSFLYLVSKISNNHYREKDFFSKIEQILTEFKNDIKKSLTNHEIFKIFKGNKRITLFLIEQDFIQIDKQIANKIINNKNTQYFYPEIKNFLSEEEQQKISSELPENFEENRKIGENEDQICEFIRNDMIDEFITHVNRTNTSLKSNVCDSIFETNPFLIGDEISLIEYAAFFGSIQIFNYLYKNGVELTSSLLIYAIHGKNPEMIHLLEEKTAKKIVENKKQPTTTKQQNKRKPKRKSRDYSDESDDESDDSDDEYLGGSSKKKSKSKSKNKLKIKSKRKAKNESDESDDSDDEYRGESRMKLRNKKSKKNAKKESANNFSVDKELILQCLNEAIKCHHNEIARFYIENYFSNENVVALQCFRYYNFVFMQNDIYEDDSSFYFLCKYDYFILVNDILKNKSIDINKITQSESNKRSKDSEEFTPLCLATEEENIDIIKILLSREDLDINIKCESLRYDINNSIIYARDWHNQLYNCEHHYVIESTPFNASVKKGNIEIVNLLLKCDNVDINFRTKYRDTYYDIWEKFIWGGSEGIQGLSVDKSDGRMIFKLNLF